MGKHDNKDEDQEKIDNEGHFPDWEIPPPDPGGKHEKQEEDEE